MFSKDQKRLIELINERYNASQISEKLGISNLQLYKRVTNIENKGFVLTRKYYSDGNLLYVPGLKTSAYENAIITKPAEKFINVLVVSDPHLGTKKEGLDELKRAYEYAAKNNIHIVFNCGDIVEGTFGQNATKFKDPVKQVDYLIKNYPHDDSILTFGVLGNHDISIFTKYGIDLKELLKSYRHDLIIINNQLANVNIKEDSVALFHKINKYYSNVQDDSSLVLNGHFHSARFYPFGSLPGKTVIDVPAMCHFNDNIPSAVKLKIKFKNGLIKRVEANQILFLDKDYEINEIDYDFPDRKAPSNSRGITQDYAFAQDRTIIDSNIECVRTQEIDKTVKDEKVLKTEEPVKNEETHEIVETVAEVTENKKLAKSNDAEENKESKKEISTEGILKTIDTGMSLEERLDILNTTYGEKKKTKKPKKKFEVASAVELTNEEKIALLVNSDNLMKESEELNNSDDNKDNKSKRLSNLEKFNKKYGIK